MEEVRRYFELLRARMEFTEKFYGFRMNYLPLYFEGDEVVVLDKNDGKVKWLRDKRPLSDEELERIMPKIKENIESGLIDTLITLNFQCIHGPED
ncbi:hypothetical protein A3L04_06085 [Thermococcus chitonophagus]|uniref:Uncharacterized protein n=1 Tax=Thermococcus chitonophagus TaxID=54262 RepID=A0A160VR74_9EURY|nr:hypothetical protein [Thermococcus chitonophagus]ASJ16668.1 hypothetical protein A3L04_06085 [Thermococcus chitonophagus]CUX77407.1 hypothetical protein CHITON_0628 [Thermococcus chitonophagus]